MRLREIYDSALKFLAESSAVGDNEDYEERAPYLLASFCNQAKATDAGLRRSLGITNSKSFNTVYIALDAEFPLLEQLATCGALYLAAMLVLDEDKELSDTLYDKYCDAISSICSSICSVSEKIADKYFGYN